MPYKPYDPLAFVPSPDVIREKLRDTQSLAERLRLLLDLSERMRHPLALASDSTSRATAGGEEVGNG